MPLSEDCIAPCLKAMLPAISVAVSTERMIAMPASDIATSTISAMKSTAPRTREGREARAPVVFARDI